MKTKNLILTFMAVILLSFVSCKKERINLSSSDLWFPLEGDTAFIIINADCNWTVSVDADWFTVSPMTSKEANDTLTVIVKPCTTTDFRTSSFTVMSEHGHIRPEVTVSQKKESISLSKYELWFPKESDTKTLEITTNCAWTVSIDDGADWYTVSPMSGEPTHQGSLTVTVQPYDGDEYRSSSFTLTSEHGFYTAKVYLSQNQLEFDEIINMVFGVSHAEHWNTDYFGQMIEDSYKHKEYDPFDTTKGYLMYFLEDGQGVQRDHHKDSVVYYAFTYSYNAHSRNLHIEFETVADTLIESYDASVLTASEELFRFCHEYKPNWWERADMRKIGTVTPGEKSLLTRAVTKRKGQNGIFQFQ